MLRKTTISNANDEASLLLPSSPKQSSTGGKVMLNRGTFLINKAKKTQYPIVITALVIIVPLISISVLLYSFIRLQATSPVTNNNNEAKQIDETSIHYQIVFSTGCSIYQDWQSYLFFYQAFQIQQPGTVTRIVSGCKPEQQQQLQQIFDEQIRTMVHDEGGSSSKFNDNFKIHFTPDYSKLKPNENYVYFNKPYGMKHWLEHVFGYPNNVTLTPKQQENTIVVLLDPDQLIMRKFQNNNFNATDWKFIEPDQIPRTTVRNGYPMGQLYGYDLQWKTKINMTTVLHALNWTSGRTTPIDQMTNQQARAGYIVGPPYVATLSDMYKIVLQWSKFVIPVHDQYPHLLAEMFAYSLAAAHLVLHHQTAISFMISDTEYNPHGEGWSFIDKIPAPQICNPVSNNSYDVPWVLHFCQRYGIGKYFFGKRRLHDTFLSCQSPLLAEPPRNVYDLYDYAIYPVNHKQSFRHELHHRRAAFVMCYMIPIINNAATYYKQHHCSVQDNPNYTKSIYLGSDGY